jgi:uncharacterized protein YecT (DUF1311 family)
MMRKIIFVLLGILCRSAVANCEDPKTQVEMTACAGQEYAGQDKKLNRPMLNTEFVSVILRKNSLKMRNLLG